ncbi:MAG: hypothetical protein KME59_11360 [Trichormus sp. ATA11-4-KO1]|nr:hypothetical protein [Trichormus sp. ATA11-4-KO1]
MTQQRQVLQVGKAAQRTGSTLRSAAAASTALPFDFAQDKRTQHRVR